MTKKEKQKALAKAERRVKYLKKKVLYLAYTLHRKRSKLQRCHVNAKILRAYTQWNSAGMELQAIAAVPTYPAGCQPDLFGFAMDQGIEPTVLSGSAGAGRCYHIHKTSIPFISVQKAKNYNDVKR